MTPGRAATVRSSCAAQFAQVRPASRNVRVNFPTDTAMLVMNGYTLWPERRASALVVRALVHLPGHVRQNPLGDLDQVSDPALL